MKDGDPRRAEELALAANGRGLEVVVVNPACVIGPDDFTSSEFGTLCRRFWLGRLPIHFGGGNNFVDVRDVASGIVSALDRGRPGERYILGGANRSLTAFFRATLRPARTVSGGAPRPARDRCRHPAKSHHEFATAEATVPHMRSSV